MLHQIGIGGPQAGTIGVLRGTIGVLAGIDDRHITVAIGKGSTGVSAQN